MSFFSKLLSSKLVQKVALAVALNVAAANIDKAGAKVKVPQEIVDKAKVILSAEAEKAKDQAAVQVIARL